MSKTKEAAVDYCNDQLYFMKHPLSILPEKINELLVLDDDEMIDDALFE